MSIKLTPIDLIKKFPDLSILDIEDIFEYFQDYDLLSKKGQTLRKEFWQEFLQDSKYFESGWIKKKWDFDEKKTPQN